MSSTFNTLRAVYRPDDRLDDFNRFRESFWRRGASILWNMRPPHEDPAMKIMKQIVALAALMTVSALSLASPLQPFDAKAFDTLTASGKPVVVAVHAS